MDAIAQMMVSTGIDEFVAAKDWVWPVCEILHFFGMALLIGSVGLADLRMLGVAKGVPIKALERLIIGHATPCSVDRAGRILAELREEIENFYRRGTMSDELIGLGGKC